MPNLLGGRLRWVPAATRRCHHILDPALSLQKRGGRLFDMVVLVLLAVVGVHTSPCQTLWLLMMPGHLSEACRVDK